MAAVRHKALLSALISTMAALLVGCVSSPPGDAARQRADAALAVQWGRELRTGHHWKAPGLAYMGIAVPDFTWHEDLDAWEYSNDLLDAALGKWLRVPAARRMRLVNPTERQLAAAFANGMPARLGADDTLIVYLGTHQRSDGRLLLDHGHILAPRLAQLLTSTPAGRVILLADVCYAAKLEADATFPDKVVRVYASGSEGLAFETQFDGREPRATRFFHPSPALARYDLGLPHGHYSICGFSLFHALREEVELRQDWRVDRWLARYEEIQRDYGRQLGFRSVEAPVVVNAKPLILARAERREPVAVASSRGASFQTDPAPDAGEADPAAGAEERLPQLKVIDELPALPPQEIRIGVANLKLGKIYDPKLVIDPYEQRLAQMADDLRPRLKRANGPEESIAILNKYIFEEQGIKAVVDPYVEDFLLHRLLDTKKGRCMALTALYLDLGERLELPLKSVVIPEHIFVRWITPEGEAYNIETTIEGVQLPDLRYRQKHTWAETKRTGRFYLRPLSARESLVAYLSPLAHALIKDERLDEAVAICRRAIKVQPDDPELWNNLGRAYRRLEKNELAAGAFRQSLEINPDFAEGWNNLGTVEADLEAQAEAFRKAVALKPGLGAAWANLAQVYYQQQKCQLAWTCVIRCKRLDYPVNHRLVAAIQRCL